MGNHVGLGVPLRAIKRAELATHAADVRVVDVPVNTISDNCVPAPVVGLCLGKLAPPVRQRPQLLKRQRVKPQRLGPVDPPAVPHLLQQFIQCGVVNHTGSVADNALQNNPAPSGARPPKAGDKVVAQTSTSAVGCYRPWPPPPWPPPKPPPWPPPKPPWPPPKPPR